MPSGTSIQRFINDLKTGKTTVCEALDALFAKPARLRTHALWLDPTKLRQPGWLNTGAGTPSAVVGQFDPDLREYLLNAPDHPISPGLGWPEADVRHMEEWPDPRKENVRAALETAILVGTKVSFFWELMGGTEELAIIDPDPPAHGRRNKITFYTPTGRVHDTQVTVDVGTP